MKSIATDYLQHRLPANQRFIQHINEEISYLTMYLSTLFPNSESNAYVLSGVEFTISGGITEGVVFYNHEIYRIRAYPPPHTPIDQNTVGLKQDERITNEEYGNGSLLPAYKEKRLLWADNVTTSDPLQFNNLIRSVREITPFGLGTAKREAKIITNGFMQSMIIHVKLFWQINTPLPATLQTGFSKQGFLGYGKIINHTKQNATDIAVYQFGDTTALTLAGYDEIMSVSGAERWQKILAAVDFASRDDTTLYINVTHERV
jgi:hypothetical protein